REGNACVPDTCGDTDNDRNHCGACGNRCGDDEICDHGRRARCGAGHHREGNSCVPNGPSCGDTDSDRDNCGGCGNRCEDDEVCEKGHQLRCTAGYTARAIAAGQTATPAAIAAATGTTASRAVIAAAPTSSASGATPEG